MVQINFIVNVKNYIGQKKDRQTNKQANRQVGQKQYARDHLIWGIKLESWGEFKTMQITFICKNKTTDSKLYTVNAYCKNCFIGNALFCHNVKLIKYVKVFFG